MITAECFQAFLQCPTKSHLKGSGVPITQNDLARWQQQVSENYKRKCSARLQAMYREEECLANADFCVVWNDRRWRLIIDCLVVTEELQSNIHALERMPSAHKPQSSPHIPIRFVPSEKYTQQDKLLLAFDALCLSKASGKMPQFGKLIYVSQQKVIKVQVAPLMKTVRSVIATIAAQQAPPPQLILNRHCAECEFQARCRQVALEKDDLSLLTGITEAERKRQHAKGIFTVTQLSHTFRPRRRSKSAANKPPKYYPALTALAIRESKIYVSGNPELKLKGNPIYLDVEGDPERDFYYLIGIRTKEGDTVVQHSFWVDDPSEERQIWVSFLEVLARIENPQILHYGSFETIFLKRMQERYDDVCTTFAFTRQLLVDAVNVLSAIYAQIYFPTYSNSLKDIAKYLGFQWSETDASGLMSLVWRRRWENSTDAIWKQKLLTYNAEDCTALELVTTTVRQLCQSHEELHTPVINSVVNVDLMKRESPHHLMKNTFAFPEMEFINQCAYWDYQRDKIYLRSSERLKRIQRALAPQQRRPLPINSVIECDSLRPEFCTRCGAANVKNFQKHQKIIYDLKFSPTAIKRWIVKYSLHRFYCAQCQATFYPPQKPWTRQKIGTQLMAYMIYQMIELRLPQRTVTKSVNQLFGFDFHENIINRQKTRASLFYQQTYDGILHKIIEGRLIHVDETRVSIDGTDRYVWVLTNLEEVVYFYTETREGETIQSLLKHFQGVLVSDFYPAYDSIDCPQQKCLIHLMRDLNDDLFKEPFNQELKELVRDFALLLKPMIETIDRFGLKAHFLRKHRPSVERFYHRLSAMDYTTETAIKNKRRFEKNREKLFTFLAYDGIPWNNNNAEHAIKAFAALRRVIGGSSSPKGISEYLTLLSICETCKLKGANFLEFLRSGEQIIDAFIDQQKHRHKGSTMLPL